MLPPISTVSVYVEFAAVFLELRYFAPDVLSAYFPSLDDFDQIEEILIQDIDLDAALEITGALEVESSSPADETPDELESAEVRTAVVPPLGERLFRRQLRMAAQAASRGNDVRAAILHTRASRIHDSERASAHGRSRQRTCGA